ncbi:serine protease, partial [Streptomyces bambusae]|nr:serine protease [Streptomyces bambusae]
MDALRLGGEVCGGPVLDAETGAVIAVLAPARRQAAHPTCLALPLRATAAADPGGALAALLARNAATVPAHGADLNLAGALQLTGTTLAPALPVGDEPEPVERPAVVTELAAFTGSGRLVAALVGAPGSGRTTELAALARRRTLGTAPAPTIWLRGADLRPRDTSLADALARALTEASRILSADQAQGQGSATAACGAGAPRSTGPGSSTHLTLPTPFIDSSHV